MRGTDRQVEDPVSGNEEDRGHDHDPGEERDPEPDALDEKAEGDPTRPSRGQDCAIQQRQSDERAEQAGGHDRHQEADELRARIASLQPAGRASVSLREDGMLDVGGDPTDGLLEPADASLGRHATRGRGSHGRVSLVASETAPQRRSRRATRYVAAPTTTIPSTPAIS